MTDCIKSFDIRVYESPDLTAPAVKTWITNGNRNWIYSSDGDISTFLIQGYQTIDIYGASVNGYIQGKQFGTGKVIVNDWNFILEFIGQSPVVSGKVDTSVTNSWNLYYNNSIARLYTLGKYNTKFQLMSPLTGVSAIKFLGLEANGINAESNDQADLLYNLGFTFYYKYSDE